MLLRFIGKIIWLVESLVLISILYGTATWLLSKIFRRPRQSSTEPLPRRRRFSVLR